MNDFLTYFSAYIYINVWYIKSQVFDCEGFVASNSVVWETPFISIPDEATAKLLFVFLYIQTACVWSSKVNRKYKHKGTKGQDFLSVWPVPLVLPGMDLQYGFRVSLTFAMPKSCKT